MLLKSAALLALVGMLLVTILVVVGFISDQLNVSDRHLVLGLLSDH